MKTLFLMVLRKLGTIALFTGTISGLMFGVAQADPTSVLDHFMCYNVEAEQQATEINISAKDQFIGQGYTVIALTKLCAPAEKYHESKIFKIKYPDAHLACYKVKPHNASGANASVIIYNQFQFENYMEVKEVVEICVPTNKKHL